MDFNHQRVRTVNGKRFVRIPKEYRLQGDTVFMYRNGHGIAVIPVNARSAKDWRDAAKWAEENGGEPS